jgi:hypothetical protein
VINILQGLRAKQIRTPREAEIAWRIVWNRYEAKRLQRLALMSYFTEAYSKVASSGYIIIYVRTTQSHRDCCVELPTDFERICHHWGNVVEMTCSRRALLKAPQGLNWSERHCIRSHSMNYEGFDDRGPPSRRSYRMSRSVILCTDEKNFRALSGRLGVVPLRRTLNMRRAGKREARLSPNSNRISRSGILVGGRLRNCSSTPSASSRLLTSAVKTSGRESI